MTKDIDWKQLGFHYTETDYIVRAECHDGIWGPIHATKDKHISLHLSATCLQYGQEAFEGLKAFRGADGRVRIFRMEENARRMARSAEGLCMTAVPEDIFCSCIELALQKNMDWVPPYETGATLYFRPLLIGTTPRLGVGPGHDFLFAVIPSPIGPYYPSGFEHATPFVVNRHVDRAAPLGTGQFKVGGNYAASFRATEAAHAQGMSCLFLDPTERHYIDECGAANFFGILNGRYVTPASSSILPSITNNSLMQLARDHGLIVEQRPIKLEELSAMSECGACGTAAVISPISRVIDPDNGHVYEFGDRPGPVSTMLYHALQDIQYGRTADSYGWCKVV
ncbi:MAG: branched-chain amino acid aminotransferase [Paludibacteraceae bacterium]|nr:branched-chain amino acid aminotransferase [Paludibacteraceae bacterium]